MDGEDDVEDIFEDGLLTIFGDVKVSHGEPGEVFCYRTPTGVISLHITDAATYEERVKLFAHFVWNAALFAADFIVHGKFIVRGESVLELGAGTGLPGILSALHGAEMVVLSDYPSPSLLANLQRNVDENVPFHLQSRVAAVEGHIWGESLIDIRKHRASFSRIIACDCFWMSDQHVSLIKTITQLLDRSSSARAFVVAGLHTGRSVLSNFFRVAASEDLIPDDKDIIEHNVTTQKTRPWRAERIREDLVERKQWLVVAQLRWSNSVLS